jgi:hypothetical protein
MSHMMSKKRRKKKSAVGGRESLYLVVGLVVGPSLRGAVRVDLHRVPCFR